MTKPKTRPRQRLLAELLERRDTFDQDGLAYRGPADFILRHGQWYQRLPYPTGFPSLPANGCFGNAMVMAAGLFGHTGLRYVEGYALFPRVLGKSRDTAFVDADPALAIVVNHGWNTDAQGNLIDATWCNGGLAYRGVVFSLERADDCAWHGDGSILQDKRGWTLLQEPWQGEPVREWPHSERLAMLRSVAASGDRSTYAHITREELWDIFNKEAHAES